jgi:hypothetical protein
VKQTSIVVYSIIVIDSTINPVDHQSANRNSCTNLQRVFGNSCWANQSMPEVSNNTHKPGFIISGHNIEILLWRCKVIGIARVPELFG